MEMKIAKSNMYKAKFDDIEYTFDVRQCFSGKREYIVFEYEFEENHYRTLSTNWIYYWYPKWFGKMIFRSAEKKFCKIISKELGRKLNYSSSLN